MKFIFFFLTLLSLSLIFFGLGKNKKIALASLIWMSIVGGLAIRNVYFEFPLFMPVCIVVAFTAIVYFYTNSEHIALHKNYLYGIHILRIPIEIFLYQLYLEGKLPELMTYSGWNFDILIGISALFILGYRLFSHKDLSRNIARYWNILGIVSLSSVFVIAILSAPLPIQQLAFDQPNIAVLEFPYAYLPTIIVPLVFLSHFLLLRDLNNK